MAAKNLFKKNKNNLAKIKNLVKKNLKIEPLDIDPTKIIKNTQSKIGNFYTNFKKEREKENNPDNLSTKFKNTFNYIFLKDV